MTRPDAGRDAFGVGAVSPQEGTTSNRYAILGRIATGGMAEIFLARATNVAGFERYVVLKRILPERARDPAFVKMFLDEARLAAQLHHPNIAQVHDIGRLGDSFFFTMEYVHGEDVRALLQRLAALRRTLPVQHALLIAAGAAAALHHAHERTGSDRRPLGVVHRDVSPSNVMVSFEGAVKLVDFGVAKATQRSTETRTGTVKGKIAYLSPEQCKGGGIDRRSDIFSLGIVMYELLTTTRLFKRETDFSTMTAIVNDEALPPSLQRPELTPAIDQVVLNALAKDPAQRYATAGELLDAIEAAAEQSSKSMSPHALGRFLRELFGERPEPWIELDVRDDAPSVVTVTSESMAAVVPPTDMLATAPMLPASSSRASGAMPVLAPSPTSAEIEEELRKTVSLRRETNGEDESGSSMPGVRPLRAPTEEWADTRRIPKQPGVESGPVGVPAPPPPGPPPGSRPTQIGTPPIPIAMPPAPRTSSPSVPPPIVGAPASGPLANAPPGVLPTTYPLYQGGNTTATGSVVGPTPEEDVDLGRPRIRRLLGISIGVGAVALGIVIGVYFATGDNDSQPPAAASVTVDAAPADRVAVTVTVDAAAAPAVVMFDAAPAVDVVTGGATIDAAPAAKPAGSADSLATSLDAIARAVGDGQWGVALRTCGQVKRRDLTADARVACAQAACGLRRRSDAISFARGLPDRRRDAVEKMCAGRGVALTSQKPAKRDPCDDKQYREQNPLSCQ